MMKRSRKLLPRACAALACLLAIIAVTAPSAPASLYDIDLKFQQPCISQGCHAVDLAGKVPRHLPYLEGQCLACHTDHTNESDGMLKPGGDALCLACHGEVSEHGREGEVLQTTESSGHGRDAGATLGSCVDCHDPHESALHGLVRNTEVLENCSTCHADFLASAKEHPFRHDFFDPVKQCGACHYAHQRQEKKFLREEVAASCLTCHDLAIQVENRKLENVGRSIREAEYVHGALEDESCPACHTPHGSVQSSLLRPGYPAGIYQPYQRENYQLCWQCHDPGLVESAGGEGVTEFRDGDINLHRVHVLEMERGRACHVCHTAHAGDNSALIRNQVSFRSWYAPLQFKEDELGGTCRTPCHREKSYSRYKTSK